MELKHSLLTIQKGELTTCGGSQMLSENKTMRRCGCGVISAMDVMEYLHRCHADGRSGFFAGAPDSGQFTWAQYEPYAERLRRKYLPLFYPVGMNGLELAEGMNRYFRRFSLPYRARWSAPRGTLWQSMEAMLAQDIPVILSIGVGFPNLWHKHRLAFYRRGADGTYRRAADACSHYVTATALTDEWIRIASWGREYYISRKEFSEHVKNDSRELLSNIVYIRKRGV